MNFETFLQFHQTQLESSRVPQVFWRTVFEKVTGEVFNTGDYFSIEKIVYEDEEEDENEEEENSTSLNGVSPDNVDLWASNSGLYEQCEYRVVVAVDRMEPTDPDNIFLIDHMCTFEELSKRKELFAQSEQLLERLCTLISLKESQLPSLAKEQKIQLVEQHIFKYLQSYCINQLPNQRTIIGTAGHTYWYILDEFGARIGHSLSEPTFRCVPFTFLQGGISYNLLFPVKAVVSGELVTRNYIESSSSSLLNPSPDSSSLTAALMLPWEPDADLTHVDYRQTVESPESFAFKHKPEEIMPTSEQQLKCSDSIHMPSKEAPLKVYSQYKYVNEHLTDERFQLVAEREAATVLWLMEPFYGYRTLPPDALVNQFPFESVLTVKDLFAIVCRRAAAVDAECDQLMTEDAFSPAWLMPTFDLQSELPKFVSYYQHRQRARLDNHWIVKPWNLSRGLETLITGQLAEIVKLRNALPKVVCKYIDRPVLFRRDDLRSTTSSAPVSVKFDLRFIVLLKSVQPLQLYVYRNFWIRFANRAFSMDELESYEKHFTVMNYAASAEGEGQEGKVQLRQMFCSEFIGHFDAQYGKGSWARLQTDTYAAIKEAFECATMKEPPAGIGHCVQSRAMYGIDVLPRWRRSSNGGKDEEEEEVMQPTLLEVNWMPDCKRATEYYPDFFNEVFATLFTDEPISENMLLL